MTTGGVESAALAAAVIVSVLVWVRHHTLVTRVRQLERTARLLASGNGPSATRFVLPGSDEAGRLADSLNDFLDGMRGRLDEERGRAAAHRELLASIAHDLRTPLTSIAGYMDALRRNIGEDRDRYIEVVTQKASDLIILTDNLFYLTRLETGDIELHPRAVDLAETARQSLLGFVPQIEAAGVRVEVDIPEDPCYVMADETALKRVLSNLISNSISHGQGKTQIGVRVDRVAGPDDPGHVRQCAGCYRVSVWDNGRGLSPEALSLIVQQGRRTTGPHGGGGFGLTIARTLAEKMGGALTVESEPFRRTCFTVLLPEGDSAPHEGGRPEDRHSRADGV